MSSGERRGRSRGRRAADRDRPLMAHGPFIRTLIGLQAFTAIAAITALVIVVGAIGGKVDKASERAAVNAVKLSALQASRKAATYDSCLLLRRLVYSAAAQQHDPRAHAGAVRFLQRNDLFDCRKYVRDKTRLLRVKVPDGDAAFSIPRVGSISPGHVAA